MRVPSGDHAGPMSEKFEFPSAPMLIACAPDPSAFMTQMRAMQPPDARQREKAIRVPSGDHSGEPSLALGIVRGRSFVPSESMRQIRGSSGFM